MKEAEKECDMEWMRKGEERGESKKKRRRRSGIWMRKGEEREEGERIREEVGYG